MIHLTGVRHASAGSQGTDKMVLVVALVLAGGFAADLLRARKRYDAKGRSSGWGAIRRWAQTRALVLGGVAALYLSFAWVILFTDLIQLPGLRYETNRYTLSAGKYLALHKYPEAALELRNALAENPDDQEIRLMLARTLHSLGNVKEAEEAYRSVMPRIATLLTPIWDWRGSCWLPAGRMRLRPNCAQRSVCDRTPRYLISCCPAFCWRTATIPMAWRSPAVPWRPTPSIWKRASITSLPQWRGGSMPRLCGRLLSDAGKILTTSFC